LTSADLPNLRLNKGKEAQLYVDHAAPFADKEPLSHRPLPVNMITHFSASFKQAITFELDKNIPIEEYPLVYSVGPDEHGRLSTFGPAPVTYADTAVTYSNAAGVGPISITVMASGISNQAFKTILEWMLDSRRGEGIAEIAGAKMTITELLHVMAAAEVLKTPIIPKEQVYGFLEQVLVNLPLDDLKNFVRHAAKGHAAQSIVVDSVSKAYREERLEQVDTYLEYAKEHDKEIYEEVKTAIDGGEEAPAPVGD
jgi:hypothetical protein